MVLESPAYSASPAALQQVLRETRQRFVATFVAQGEIIRSLVEQLAALGPSGPVAELTQITHRLNGLAGTIGFPTISVRAAELGELVGGAGRGAFDAVRARDVVNAIREAFVRDLASPPEWAPTIARAAGATILVAEDEADQLAIVTACLVGAGYVAVPVVSGDLVVDVARAEKPALILLDIAMPELDGYSVCRLLKADPALVHIPVVFMTTGDNLEDRLAGLTLGADEFLSKPVDMRELVLRIQLLLKRSERRPAPTVNDGSASRALTYDAFLAVADEEISQSPAALAVVRLPAERYKEGTFLIAEEIRGRDAMGAHGPTRLLILMPEMTAAAARDRLEPMANRLLAHGLGGICVGVTAAPGDGTKTVVALIGEADEALAEARYLGKRTAIWTERPERPDRPAAVSATRRVVIAEDDPDVTRIVDAQVRAAGYEAIIASDGEQALAAVRAHAPDVLVLDLMMPKFNGFDVLTELRDSPAPRPQIIVLSGRGREQDVMRGFELGADDYMTKPFNPQELIARIGRLLVGARRASLDDARDA